MVSSDEMFGFEARAFIKRLAKLLAEEWEKPCSTVRGFINARMSIVLVRATTRSLEVPGSLRAICRIAFVGGVGLGLLKSDN